MRPVNLIDFYRLRGRQWSPAGAIGDLQSARLRRLIRHAYASVPYYRQLFDSAGVDPRQIRSAADLSRIPVTTRETLADLSPAERTARGVDLEKCRRSVTSGTTGVPLATHFSPRDATLINLSWIRAFSAAGMKPSDRSAAFVGRREVKRTRSWYEHFGLFRRREISAWESPDLWLDQLLRWRPRVITGYVMTLKLLAEVFRERRVDDWSPEHIFHSSAILDRGSRRKLESVFSCRVTDFYGSDEGGCLAWECRRCRAYHICSDMVVVEVLQDGVPADPGEEGEVVITNLHSSAQPLIRYRQNDIVRRAARPPVCGRSFPLLDRVRGRVDDFIVLKSGRKISPHPVYHSLDPLKGIRRWRVIQESPDTLTVEIEPAGEFDDSCRGAVERNLRALTAGEIGINVILRDKIPVDPDAKFRAVSSRIGSR